MYYISVSECQSIISNYSRQGTQSYYKNVFWRKKSLCLFNIQEIVKCLCSRLKESYYIRKKYSRTLTHSLTELSPSWEAANCAAIQKLPSILWNLKVHYCVHMSPPLVPMLSHIDPAWGWVQIMKILCV
jgi:cyclopropane fatty-acyl-phospholipid synthase-like methyltransferase